MSSYSFPKLSIEPGEVCESEISVDKPFKANKLVMSGFMNEIRGNFKIKHTKRPLLDRNFVTAYSRISRYKSKQRTYVKFDDGVSSFEKSYLPKNVVYLRTDALDYIQLDQLYFGDENTSPAMPFSWDGVPANYFGDERLGVGMSFPTTETKVKIFLRNIGNIRVDVYAMLMGMSYEMRA